MTWCLIWYSLNRTVLLDWIIICGHNDNGGKWALMHARTMKKQSKCICFVGRLVGRTHFMRNNANSIQFVRTNVCKIGKSPPREQKKTHTHTCT